MFLTAAAQGQPPSADADAKFKAWLSETIRIGRDGPPLSGLKVQWHLSERYVPEAKELEAMRLRVAQQPDPDEVGLLKMFERRLQVPDELDLALWSLGDGFRLNVTILAPERRYYDRTIAGNTGWMLADDKARVFDTRRPPPPGSEFRQQFMSEQLREMTDFWAPGCYPAPPPESVAAAKRTGSTWGLDTTWSTGTVTRRLVLAGAWDEGSGYGTVTHARTHRAHASGETATVIEASQWNRVEGLPRPVAHFVKRSTPAGRVLSELSLTGIAPLTAREFADVTRVPSLESADSVRGTAPVSLYDMRNQEDAISVRNKKGELITVPGPLVKQATADSRLAQLGWALAACCFGVLAVLWLRSRRGSHAARGG